MGLFQSINPMIKYHPRKAHIITDALSKNQRSTEEPEQKVEENAGSLFVLTSSMEMDQEECHKWVNEYEAYPRLRTVLASLR